MQTKRKAGILLPIFSLPSPYGIGTMGKAAYNFIDFLKDAGQSYWQILPLGPTGYGDSPYQSASSFAGNPYFIDLDMLVSEGLLRESELPPQALGECRIDYGYLYENRMRILSAAAKRGLEKNNEEYDRFLAENSAWLEEYALFTAVKAYFDMLPWHKWTDESIRNHLPDAVSTYKDKLSEEIRIIKYIQFLFFKQWTALRDYAHENGISIIGDVPIYVPLDSADVWSERQWFTLGKDGLPTAVAGCPPDAFTEDGQLWGNPLYDYDAMKADGYGWWIRRIGGAVKLYDVIRIDHFRGFADYWEIPAGAESAKAGCWRTGPGMDLVGTLTGWFNETQFIAEDLGELTPVVYELLDKSGLPGMKVLEFAFDPNDEEGAYLPHNHIRECVCYTGTHDNEPLAGWLSAASKEELELAGRYLGAGKNAAADELGFAVMRAGMASVSKLFIAQMQDYLGLGSESRINIPGTASGNWTWRLEEIPSKKTANMINKLLNIYGRGR